MAEARMHNGKAIVAYVNGKAVDSEGQEIKGAPKPPKDTDPSQQAGRPGALTSEERIGVAIAQAILNPQAAVAKAQAAEAATAGATDDEDDGVDSEEEEGLPSLPDMQAHLANITDSDELKAMRRSDKRKGAKPLYAARLTELEGGA